MSPEIDFEELISRKVPPVPWEEGEKIPWNEPAFSARMLHEHLSQGHNAASRKSPIIAGHIEWIHKSLLESRGARILDLCCGPGLYTNALAALGHQCVGIDYSPASIEYARMTAGPDHLAVEYIEGDIRSAPFGSRFGLVMLIHGESNVFHPRDLDRILKKARSALSPGGFLLLEVHTFEAVQEIGQSPARWGAFRVGLWAAEPRYIDRVWRTA